MTSRLSASNKQTQLVILGLAAAATVSLLYYILRPSTSSAGDDSGDVRDSGKDDFEDVDLPATPKSKDRSNSLSNASTDTTTTSNLTGSATASPSKKSPRVDDKALHAKIEEMDRKGKALFKEKKFLEAAQAFTDALDHIEEQIGKSDKKLSSSLSRQIVTLYNNRSAMYEKGGFQELALEDCTKILDDYDKNHTKARLRKLRLFEQQSKTYEALVEVCALQLLYMQQNRDKLRMGLPPSSPPPVPQSKLEELLALSLPEEIAKWEKKFEEKRLDASSLPSDYTLLQLLKSYTGYNSWMAKAAKDGSVDMLDSELAALPEDSLADRASLMMKKGRRFAFDGNYQKALETLLEAYKLIDGKPEVSGIMDGDDHARLLEWTGMVRHWTYDLEGANSCYEKCAEMEPLNAEIIVKQAGVAMDAGKHERADELFEKALTIDPNAVDALLHRANLRMLQTNLAEAENDLRRCIKLRPDHIMARLRLAAVLSSKDDPTGARKQLDMAEKVEPNSSEVQSYRGELLFTQNDFAGAKLQFQKAINLEPKNPTPYVNAALAELNTPVTNPGDQIKMAQEAVRLLETAVTVDPQFTGAYVQLGQLKLGMSTDLNAAQEVISLYEQGLTFCRTREETKELASMRLLTLAQVDAARMLKMETFNMQ